MKAQMGRQKLKESHMNYISVHSQQNRVQRVAQRLNWLEVSELFVQCSSICEYHILFLSCTVLFETLAKHYAEEAVESWLR